MFEVRRIILFCIFLLFIGCTAQPEQTIVEKPGITGKIVEDTTVGSGDVHGDIQDVSGSQEVEQATEAEVFLEDGVIGLPKGTSGWAVNLALPRAREWAGDAVLFEVKGINLFDGKIRDDYDIVSDNKVYQGYFVVSFTAESKEFREILDITVNWEGVSDRVVMRYLPENFAVGYRIEGWTLDSVDTADVLETVRQGAGFSIPLFDLRPSGFLKSAIGKNSNRMTTDEGVMTISDVYKRVDPGIPVCTVETNNEISYDIDCSSGKIIGFY